MYTTKTLLVFFLISFSIISCGIGNLRERANNEFGDQHFKTAIALIELYKIRNGYYPASLDSIKFMGEWDKMISMNVKYERLDSGYSLDLVNGWLGRPTTLRYPDDFWKGLGLIRSNMKR